MEPPRGQKRSEWDKLITLKLQSTTKPMPHTKTIFLAVSLNNSAFSKYYLALARELVNRSYKVVLLVGRNKKNLESKNSNPAIYTWPSIRPTKLRDAFFLSKMIKKCKPVAIIGNFAAVNISLIVSWLLGTPLRYATYRTSNKRPNSRKCKINLSYQKIRKMIVYRFATKVLAVSKAMSKEITQIYKIPPRKITYFYNAIEVPSIDIYFKKPVRRNLVCVGGLNFGKGQDVLIRSMPFIINKYPDLKLNLIGSGELKNELTSLVNELGLENNIDFFGQIPHREIFQHVSRAYALILPTRFEAFGFVIIEAMSVGTPVVASMVGGIPEIVRNGVDGFLVQPDDSHALAETIINLLDHPDLRDQMGNNARKRFLEKFELQQAVHKQADWLEKEIKKI